METQKMRSMAELMNDPRYLEALERARDKSLRAPAPYEPPAKPITRYTRQELEDAIRHCNHCGGTGVVRLAVPVTDSRFGKAYPCQNCHPYQIELHSRWDPNRMEAIVERYTMLRGSLLTKTFRNFDPYNESLKAAHKAVYGWAVGINKRDEGARPWAFLYGSPGTGKTHLAAAAANAMKMTQIPVIFSTWPEVLGMISANGYESREPVIKALQDIPVLIIDDVREGDLRSDWTASVFFRILDHRYVTRRATMVVSNNPLNSDAGINSLAVHESRVASRLGDKAIGYQILVTAPDYRTQG